MFISKGIKDLLKMRVKSFAYSAYNEFSYGLGVFFYQLLCLDVNPSPDINLKSNINTQSRQLQISSGISRVIKELISD